GEPVVLEDAARPLYHAALVHGANHVVTLVAQASALLAAAGVDDPGRLLGPLVHASVDGALADAPGAVSTLTGPVVRGDAGTVASHVEALASRPEAAQAYRAVARATADVALSSGRIGPAAYAAVIAALGDD
ncbi:MAG: oxidoreductase, partial [Actinobacteria bacterium HGW-Actinobacteria-8]